MTGLDKISEILRYAILAPSVDNCQPWCFSISGNAVEIRLDKPRAEFFGDYAFTASYVTLGAVVENMTVAAAHMHGKMDVDCFPNHGGDEPVARLIFTDNAFNAPDNDKLFPFLEKRCTNRRPYRWQTLDQSTLQVFRGIAEDKARLIIIDDPKLIKEYATVSATVDQVIFEHQQLHANLFKWMRWSRHEASTYKDGMGVKTLELSLADRCAFRMISSWPLLNFLNRFGISRLIAKTNSARLRQSPAVGLLVVNGSEDQDYFRGGRLLERVWLQATAEGLAFQPYGGLPFLLTRIKRAGNEGFSQKHYKMLQQVQRRMSELGGINDEETLIMLFRLGYADPPSERTQRRPLSEILKNPEEMCH